MTRLRPSDRTLPLGRYSAGRLGRSAAGLLLTALLAACADSGQPLNVVVITIDTLRADPLGIYGNPGGHSPNIDALAREAVVFENAVTPIGTTFPSHASMFTGLYPRHHGVRWNGDRLADGFVTLAEVLAARDYETAACVSFGKMLTHGGLHQGFAAASDQPGEDPRFLSRDGSEVNAQALEWLDRGISGPFFLWLHYGEPHTPYRLTSYSRQRLAEAGYDGPLADGATTEDLLALGDTIPWTPAQRAALRVLYDGEVRAADRLAGAMIDELRGRNLLAETIVVVTADHGEALGEHDEVLHGFLLWQPVIQVPLVIRDPRSPEARRVAQRVSLIDLTPTILDLLGFDSELANKPDGSSLAPALRGARIPSRRLFAEVRALAGDSRRELAESRQVAVFDRNLKAIWSGRDLRVFDLARDPRELDPLPASELPGAAGRQLAELLATYFESAVDPAQTALSESMERELRALGYLR